MRQFNYYGQVVEEDVDEEDVEKLEKEIEEVLKNRRIGIENTDTLNIKGGGNIVSGRGKSANPGARSGNINRIPNDEIGDVGDDIYEDEESSDGEV